MKNSKLILAMLVTANLIVTNLIFAQICPIKFPKSGDVCLEGVNTPADDICFRNESGNLKFKLYANSSVQNSITPDLFALYSNGNFQLGDTKDINNKLIIKGANNVNYTTTPSYYRDISYEFLSAGSAKIRSFRGGSWGTYIQFLTNLDTEGTDNPKLRMQINDNGKIGIGTQNPQELLDVNGNAKFSGKFLKLDLTPGLGNDAVIQRSNNGNLVINSGLKDFDGIQESIIYLNYAQVYGAGRGGVRLFDGDTQNFVGLKMISTTQSSSITTALPGAFLISPSGGTGGRVVISDANNIPYTPNGYKSYVANGVLSEKFKAAVKNGSQWSDYVFDSKYSLMPLAKVEKYIKTNKHLPNIPSTEEIIKDGGIDLGEMQAKQMTKIEELTLYMIDMKKKLKY